MTNYWSNRLRVSLDKSVSAPSPEEREIHLRVAEYYQSMECLCSRREQSAASLRHLSRAA